MELGIGLALACAVIGNVSMLCKHRGARRAPEVRLSHPLKSAGALFASRWWTIGFALAAVAWLFHVAAMAVAPLSLVQAVVAGGIVLLAYPAERYFGHRLRRREWAGLSLAAAGLAFLALTVPSESHSGYSASAMIAFEAAAIGIGFALLFSGGRRGRGAVEGVVLGAAAGLLLGVSNVAIKALTTTVAGDLLALVGPWTAIAILGGIGSFFALARGMQLGAAIPVIAGAAAASNCAAILGGVIVFGDQLGSDPVEGVARAAAFAAVIVATALIPGPVRAAERA
jgi:hypothetical protein